MSQTAKQNPAPKHTPMSEQTQQETPIIGASPDDPIEVQAGPGQPAQRQD